VTLDSVAAPARVDPGGDGGSTWPLDAVLVWLSEAHAYPSRTAYVRSIIDVPREQVPLERILDRVDAYERGRDRGGRPQDVEVAVDQASRAAVFRYQLVLAIEDAAATFADRFDAVMLPGDRATLRRVDRMPRRPGSHDMSVVEVHPSSRGHLPVGAPGAPQSSLR